MYPACIETSRERFISCLSSSVHNPSVWALLLTGLGFRREILSDRLVWTFSGY